MSAFKQKLARLGATAGVLAATTAAIMAVGGADAATALACPTNPLNIEGRGSSLQKIAQQEWTGREVPSNEVKAIPHTAFTPARGYASACPSATVSYTSTSSGSGLSTFRYNGTGVIENGNHVGETHGYSFVSSDDGPTTAQIENAEAATSGGVASGANALVIPKIETSIAVIYNLPENCSLTFNSSHGITWSQLNEVFGGSGIKNWNGLTSALPTGAGCANEFKRVVRAEGSGTTFQFKNYLSVESAVNMPCNLEGWEEPAEAAVASTNLWANMRAIKLAGEAPNTTWPKPSNCAGTTAVETAAGGGALVKYVSEHPGTIGYASLPDAKSSNNIGGAAKIAWLQNNGPLTVTFATPEVAAAEESNCGARTYTVPVGGREGESGQSIDWSKVFGAQPTIGGSLYPLCTLTYGLSWSSYEKAGYAEPANKAENVKEYMNYVLSTGQSVKHWYQPLPHPAPPANNVLAAAKLAAGHIG